MCSDFTAVCNSWTNYNAREQCVCGRVGSIGRFVHAYECTWLCVCMRVHLQVQTCAHKTTPVMFCTVSILLPQHAAYIGIGSIKVWGGGYITLTCKAIRLCWCLSQHISHRH